MAEPNTTDELADECVLFSSYLVGKKPNQYIIEKYKKAHEGLNLLPENRFDKVLIGLANRNSFLTRLSDTYCQIFFKKSLLRKKLTLLLGILESSASTYQNFEKANGSALPILFIRLFWILFLFILTAIVSILLLLPLQLFTKTIPGFQKKRF